MSGVERDAAQLTIPAVAERAGVNPTTIYRRWGTPQALLAEVRPAH
ncbi:helix-turn-helix domain-containing protein [Kitasatospora sp. NPDC050543]